MPSLAQLLRRLRRHAVPGRAQPPAAVPVDRAEQIEQELAPVFAVLAPIAEAARVQVERATREAEHILDEARARARQTMEDAERRYPAEAAAEMARELARIDAEAARAISRAEAAAQDRRAATRRAVEALSGRMVQFALALPDRQQPAIPRSRPDGQNGV